MSASLSSSAPASAPAPVRTRGGHFVDPQGRVLLLRGVNLGGSSKLPVNYAHTDAQDFSRFLDAPHAAAASFVGRPFPLADADAHLSRLRRWGLTCVRLIVTWEAVEHAGPGRYDREYLAYVRALVAAAARHGLRVFVDPHQDAWSRWTGGDGAPLWTLELAGLDARGFAATKAALCVETSGAPPSQFPKMIWPTNYFKMACATMFTLFYAGERFAPAARVAATGEHVQHFLQRHYLDAMAELAAALAGLPNVLGFGAMNEPSAGFVGLAHLDRHFHSGELKYGYAPTPFQGMALADGLPATVERWSDNVLLLALNRPAARERVDPKGVRAWLPGRACVWREAGVWDVDAVSGEPKLLRPAHFAGVDFGRDCCVPFAERFAARIRQVLPAAVFFLELPPLEFSRDAFPDIDPRALPNAANATHWYDGVTLFLQRWTPWFTVDPRSRMPAFGRGAVRRMHARQLRDIADYGHRQMRGAPTLIGETGIPFNLNGARAFRSGDYRAQEDALDNTISSLEDNLLSYTLWCYSADNCHAFGDLWNREDLSLVSADTAAASDDRSSSSNRSSRSSSSSSLTGILATPDAQLRKLDACARAPRAFVRPHAVCVAGIPSRSRFLLDRVRYELHFDSDAIKRDGHGGCAVACSEVFVPHLQYPRGYSVAVSDGSFAVDARDGFDLVRFEHDDKRARHWLIVTSNDPRVEARRLAREWAARLATAAALAAAIAVIYLIARG